MTGPERTTVKLTDLVRDDRLRFRVETHAVESARQDYLEVMDDAGGWGPFPPVRAIRLTETYTWETLEVTAETQLRRFHKHEAVEHSHPAGTLLLVAGFTRTEAAELAGTVKDVPAEVYSGTWIEALRLAWPENSMHGRVRTAFDMKRVLDSIHDTTGYREKGEREIAALAGCSRATVNRYRIDVKRAKEIAESATKATLRGDTPSGVNTLHDAWGREVPVALVEQFRAVQAAKRCAEQARSWGKKIINLAYGKGGGHTLLEPGLSGCDVRTLAAEALRLADTIDSTLPFAVCVGCDGDGGDDEHQCPTCKGTGFLLRAAADNLPPDLERKAREELTPAKRR